MLTFDNGHCRQFQCRWGFPRRTCPYAHQSCVLLNVVVVVGRQAVNVSSSCTSNNLHLSKSKHMQRGQCSRAAPGPIFGRAFRQSLIGATFPNRNSASLKSDIVSKQCPCIPLDTETSFSKSETFLRQGEDAVACILWKCERKDELSLQNRQDEGQSHLY